MEGFPQSARVEVRWRDLDAFDHVNNAVYVSYLEHARVVAWRGWLARRGPNEGPSSIPFVVARIEIDYRRPIRLGQDVEIGLGVSRIGRTSFTYRYRVAADGETAAEATSVQVCVDKRTLEPIEITEELRVELDKLLLPGA